MRCLRALLALCLTVLLGACAGGGPSTAPLPSYGLGDSYHFNDGTSRSVKASSGDTVFWRLGKRGSLTTTRDVMLPALLERTPDMVVRNRLDSTPELFPLVPGKQIAFNTVTARRSRTHGDARRTLQHWRCKVGDTEAVDTPAGRFHTIRVACTIWQTGSAQVLHRTYLYAPSIGFYVRREDRAGDGPAHRLELTGFSIGNPALADSALRRRIEAIQHALEHDVSGDPVSWRDPVSDASGSVDPQLTLQSRRYGWCRLFHEQMKVAERQVRPDRQRVPRQGGCMAGAGNHPRPNRIPLSRTLTRITNPSPAAVRRRSRRGCCAR